MTFNYTGESDQTDHTDRRRVCGVGWWGALASWWCVGELAGDRGDVRFMDEFFRGSWEVSVYAHTQLLKG